MRYAPPMRNRSLFPMLSFFFATLLLWGCGDSIEGSCNSCPNWTSMNTSQCAAIAAEAGCERGEAVEVTDDSCGIGMPPTKHLVCEYSGCSKDVNCTAFASP